MKRPRKSALHEEERTAVLREEMDQANSHSVEQCPRCGQRFYDTRLV